MNGDALVIWQGWPPAKRKAWLYGLLTAGGWALESETAVAVGLGGLIGALVEMWSETRRRNLCSTGGTASLRN